MHRITMIVMSSLLTAALGCEQMHMKNPMSSEEPMSMADMRRPLQPVQMKQLEPFIGTWEGTAEMVPPAGSPAATQPVSPEMTFKGGGTHEWTLDGMAMKSTGWHVMPNDQKMNMVNYTTWDSREQKFRSFSISDWGESGSGWMWADPSGQKFYWNSTSTAADGRISTVSGTSTLVDANTIEWTMAGRGAMGKMQMKGTATRVR